MGQLRLFFRQQAKQDLALAFVSFLRQQAAEMLDIETSHGAVHGADSLTFLARTIEPYGREGKIDRGLAETILWLGAQDFRQVIAGEQPIVELLKRGDRRASIWLSA